MRWLRVFAVVSIIVSGLVLSSSAVIMAGSGGVIWGSAGDESSNAPGPQGVTFDRRLSGDKVGQHKAPPLGQVAVEISVSSQESLFTAALADYFPVSWTVLDAGGGNVSAVDDKTGRIEWPIGNITAGETVIRQYSLMTPQRTIPPTKYWHWSELSYGGGSASSDPWMVIVGDPNETHYFHAADVVVGSTTYNTVNSLAPAGVLDELSGIGDRGSYTTMADGDGVSIFVSNQVPVGKQWDLEGQWTFDIYFASSPQEDLDTRIVRMYRISQEGDATLINTETEGSSPSMGSYPSYILRSWTEAISAGTTIGPGERFGLEFRLEPDDDCTMYIGFDSATQSSRADMVYTQSDAPGNVREAHFRIGEDTPLNVMEWYNSTDNKTGGVPRSQNFRVRFQVYNNGASAKSWLPQLEYRELGGSWAAVPTSSGSAPFFVATTSQFANGDTIATGDFGCGTGTGNAVAGYAYEATPPASISLGAGLYTEIEFNVQANSNADYYTPYSFRLTDGGTDLYSYSNDAVISVSRDDNPDSVHQGYTDTEDKCAACHRTHTATGIVLRKMWPEESLCNSCHDGSSTRDNVAVQFSGKTYTHAISATAGNHTMNEGSYNWLPAGSRHVECEDCHNPHAASTGVATTTWGDISATIENVWGVAVANPVTEWTALTSSNYTRISSITEEYQLCLKCHSSYAYDTTPPLTHSGGITETDQAKEFNVNNDSYHWVENDLTAASGDTPRTNTADRDMTFTSGSGMDKDTPMTCSDCHASETSSEPRGAHGSDREYLLKGSWSDTTTGTSYGLCLLCHDQNVYATPGQTTPDLTSFAGTGVGSLRPNLHSYHFGKSETKGCQNCHSAVPHGGWNRAMLVEDSDPAPYSNGSKLDISSWANPGSWQKSNCGSSGMGGHCQ